MLGLMCVDGQRDAASSLTRRLGFAEALASGVERKTRTCLRVLWSTSPTGGRGGAGAKPISTRLGAASRWRRQRILGPGMLRVAPAQLRPHLGPGATPEP